MDSSKNVRWIIPFKKFSIVRVKNILAAERDVSDYLNVNSFCKSVKNFHRGKVNCYIYKNA